MVPEYQLKFPGEPKPPPTGKLVEHNFGTGPHSVAFTDGTIDAMAISSTETRMDGHERTRQSGREEGFNFCVDPRTKVQKSVVPGQRLPEQAWPWAVLNAGGRCYGDHCSVMLDKGCPDTFDIEADAETGEEYQINILPGMEYGTHHTHPDRERVRPSVADKLLMIEDAVYQKGPAFSCITALPESMKFPPSWFQGKNGDLFTEVTLRGEKNTKTTIRFARLTTSLTWSLMRYWPKLSSVTSGA